MHFGMAHLSDTLSCHLGGMLRMEARLAAIECIGLSGEYIARPISAWQLLC